MLVMPDGKVNTLGYQYWNATDACCDIFGSGVDDVAYIAGLIEEVGRHALPSPLIPTLAASLVLRAAGLGPAREQLRRIAGGRSASLAITPESGSWEPESCAVSAIRQEEGYALQGAAHFVQDAFKADVFITTARIDDELLLCALPSDAPGLSLERSQTF